MKHKLRLKKDKDLHKMIEFLIFNQKRTFTIKEIVNELWQFRSLGKEEAYFIYKAYITKPYLMKVVAAKVSIYRKNKRVLRLSQGRYLVL